MVSGLLKAKSTWAEIGLDVKPGSLPYLKPVYGGRTCCESVVVVVNIEGKDLEFVSLNKHEFSVDYVPYVKHALAQVVDMVKSKQLLMNRVEVKQAESEGENTPPMHPALMNRREMKQYLMMNVWIPSMEASLDEILGGESADA